MNRIISLFWVILIGSIWLYPAATPALGILLLLSSMGSAIHAIFKEHKESEGARAKIIADVLVLIGTFALILFLGGLAGLFANDYARPHVGASAAFLIAILVSLLAGYSLKKIIAKLSV